MSNLTAGNKTQFATLDQSNLVDTVKDRLLEAIASGELPPGSRIVEAELARRMGISRAPVREAARLLQQWGILTAEARRGFFVRKVSLDEIDHLVDYRICLQTHAARRAVSFASNVEIQTLRALYDNIVVSEKDPDGDRLEPLNRALAFHRYTFELARNPRLEEAFHGVEIQVRQIATLVNLADDMPEFFSRYLLRVVEAFESGDANTAADAIESYLLYSRDQTKRFYREHYGRS